jgi:hypothetical protein
MVNGAGDIQQRSARTRRFVTVLWVLCAALVLGERFSEATIRAVQTDFAAPAMRHLACQSVAAVPEVLFLLALWFVRQTVAAFARGELFAPLVPRMLERVGIFLICGSLTRILIVPGACRLLGFDAGYWIAFDASGMVLCAIGLALHAIAGVLRRAASIESELSEIF